MAQRRAAQLTWAQVEREQARAAAAQARAQAAQLRTQAAIERERQRNHASQRAAEVAALNEQITGRVEALEGLLAFGLAHAQPLDFSRMKARPAVVDDTSQRYRWPEPAPDPARFTPLQPTGLAKIFGKKQYAEAAACLRAEYDQACAAHAAREEVRQKAYLTEKAAYDLRILEAKKTAEQQHAEVDAFEQSYRAGSPEQVAFYNEMLLTRSEYPDGFIAQMKVAYVAESRQLVVEYELPTTAVIPAVKNYRYVKSTDIMTETSRPASQIRSLYASVVAQVTLRSLHEVFVGDVGQHIDTIVFNGMVDTVNPGNGQPIRPCLVTVRTTRDEFAALDLRLVDPLACLKHLSASVSKSPAELVPVRPVLEFSMVDARFVAESDAMALLDERPNLMELSPSEFEALIQNLFTKMGLEAKQTRASRDGGVDCVAFDTRPIFGGKVVIQAKRYKHTVGVSAVRDLFGTLQNEGASKGILVTTSGYGKASFEFAQNKPIELIDGAQLLYLLKAHADIDARIQAPEDWTDPEPDAAPGPQG